MQIIINYLKKSTRLNTVTYISQNVHCKNKLVHFRALKDTGKKCTSVYTYKDVIKGSEYM